MIGSPPSYDTPRRFATEEELLYAKELAFLENHGCPLTWEELVWGREDIGDLYDTPEYQAWIKMLEKSIRETEL